MRPQAATTFSNRMGAVPRRILAAAAVGREASSAANSPLTIPASVRERLKSKARTRRIRPWCESSTKLPSAASWPAIRWTITGFLHARGLDVGKQQSRVIPSYGCSTSGWHTRRSKKAWAGLSRLPPAAGRWDRRPIVPPSTTTCPRTSRWTLSAGRSAIPNSTRRRVGFPARRPGDPRLESDAHAGRPTSSCTRAGCGAMLPPPCADRAAPAHGSAIGALSPPAERRRAGTSGLGRQLEAGPYKAGWQARAHLPRDLPCDDFYADWAAGQLWPRSRPTILPTCSSPSTARCRRRWLMAVRSVRWHPDATPGTTVAAPFAFVDALEKCPPSVCGVGPRSFRPLAQHAEASPVAGASPLRLGCQDCGGGNYVALG